jgi:hypothetical protein
MSRVFASFQAAYGEFALFFHDMYGGDIIAVLLKPDSTAPKQVEVSGYLTL